MYELLCRPCETSMNQWYWTETSRMSYLDHVKLSASDTVQKPDVWAFWSTTEMVLKHRNCTETYHRKSQDLKEMVPFFHQAWGFIPSPPSVFPVVNFQFNFFSFFMGDRGRPIFFFFFEVTFGAYIFCIVSRRFFSGRTFHGHVIGYFFLPRENISFFHSPLLKDFIFFFFLEKFYFFLWEILAFLSQ